MRIQPAAASESLSGYSARVSTRYETDWQEIQAQIAAAGGGGGGGAVSSVFGRTGAVVAASGDYTFAQIGSKPTTVAGYGITDALTSVTLTGDVTGTGGASFATTLATVTPGKGGTGLTTYTLGDILYSSSTNTLAKLTGNTSATRNKLVQTGTGTISAAPAWVKDDWEYLGGVAPLGSTNATLLAATTIAARDELMIVVGITGYTGAATGQVQFNASATGHTYRWLTAAAGGTTFAAGTNTASNGANVKVGPADTTNPRHVVIHVQNRANDATNGEKPIVIQSTTGSGASGTQLAIDLFAGSFFSTSQITQVSVIASANSFKAGSFVEIWGRNASA